MGRTLKIVGISGGGLLLVGSGAIGSHYAQPLLEDQFHPERKQRESKLSQNFHNKSDQVEYLGRELNEQKKINSLQRTNISSLDKELKKLDSELSDKKKEVEGKDRKINEIKGKLSEKEQENSRQKSKITSLEGTLEQRKKELQNESESKKRIEDQLNYRRGRLALTKEHILTQKTIDLDLLKIKTEKIEFKNFKDGWAEFEVTDRNGKKITIKVNEKNPTNHESVVEKIRENGIPFLINSDAFGKWNKEVKLTRFDVYYDQKIEDKSKEKNYVLISSKNESTINLKEYFRESYLQEAFKVYVAMTKIDYFPLRYDWSQKIENKFYFCSDSQIWENILQNLQIDWNGFDPKNDSQKFSTWTSRFLDTNSFIRYWAYKTVEFTRTGTVDFSDLLNPVNKLKYYQKN